MSNPFFEAYLQSDWMGKLIFLALLSLSVLTWAVVVQTYQITQKAKRRSRSFKSAFERSLPNPFQMDTETLSGVLEGAPFLNLYNCVKEQIISFLEKNRAVDGGGIFLHEKDLDAFEYRLEASRRYEVGKLEKHLFLLSMIVTLAPFLGLLGTVWGILTSFSQLQFVGSTSQAVLSGLSMALATTVLGLIDAIPALIGYNLLKNEVKKFDLEMESFSSDLLAAVGSEYGQN